MTTILLKNKNTSAVPLAGDLTNAAGGAELALNTADRRLYAKNGGGTVVEMGNNPTELTVDNLYFNGNTIVSTDTNGNINLTPNGTGSVVISKLQVTGGIQFDGNITIGDSPADTLTVNSTITSNLIFTDNTYDIGASGATRPRSIFLAGNATVGGLTSGRVTFAGSGGLLSDAAGLTWDGTNLTASQLRSSGLTSGRVTFAGASGLLSDSANLTWNGSAFAITGALTATTDSTFSSTGALTISKGNTSQRPGSPTSGMLRFNTQTSEFEGYNGTAWASVGGAAIVNDTSTATNVFPLFANATSGTAATVYTSNAKLLYKPSTGELQASEMVASNGIFVNSKTVTANYTVPSGSNAMSSGPVTVADGITVTVSDGSVWTVI
jgi:hypothetical protein